MHYREVTWLSNLGCQQDDSLVASKRDILPKLPQFLKEPHIVRMGVAEFSDCEVQRSAVKRYIVYYVCCFV